MESVVVRWHPRGIFSLRIYPSPANCVRWHFEHEHLRWNNRCVVLCSMHKCSNIPNMRRLLNQAVDDRRCGWKGQKREHNKIRNQILNERINKENRKMWMRKKCVFFSRICGMLETHWGNYSKLLMFFVYARWHLSLDKFRETATRARQNAPECVILYERMALDGWNGWVVVYIGLVEWKWERVRDKEWKGICERKYAEATKKPSYFMQFNSLITFFAFSFHIVVGFCFFYCVWLAYFFLCLLKMTRSVTLFTISNAMCWTREICINMNNIAIHTESGTSVFSSSRTPLYRLIQVTSATVNFHTKSLIESISLHLNEGQVAALLSNQMSSTSSAFL